MLAAVFLVTACSDDSSAPVNGSNDLAVSTSSDLGSNSDAVSVSFDLILRRAGCPKHDQTHSTEHLELRIKTGVVVHP